MATKARTRKMDQVVDERRRRHRMALAAARMTHLAFCEGLGFTVNHVNEVLRGRRPNARILAEVEKFARKHLGK